MRPTSRPPTELQRAGVDIGRPASRMSVFSFDAAESAVSGLRLIERAERTGTVSVDDVAVVEWPEDHPRPVAYQVGAADGTAALSGAFWGLLFGSLLLAPLAGLSGPIWPPDGLARIGLPESMLDEIRVRTRPGTSALFVFISGGDKSDERLRGILADHQSRCTTTSLTIEQDRSLRRAFGVDDDIPPKQRGA